MTNTRNAPVEAIEAAYPLRVIQYALAPDTGVGPREAVRLGELSLKQPVHGNHPRPWARHAAGLAHYRAGHYKEAVRWFQDGLERSPAWDGRALNWLGLALAYHRLGKAGEARRWRDAAGTWMDRTLGPLLRRTPGAWPMHLHDAVSLQLLRQEADRVLGVAGPK